MKPLFLFFWSVLLFSQVFPQFPLKPEQLGALNPRFIGPAAMSGRITDIDASNKNPDLLYVASAGGGIWKSTNSGTSFKSVFNKHNQATSVVVMDQKNNSVIWVGTGEQWVRNSISIGNGVYKSTDGGDSWTHMGLQNTQHISEIIIDPVNSNIIYVAALGSVFSANKDRGIFKSIDGGKSWKNILFVDENTGCASLIVDPLNPQIFYAAMWDFRRTGWNFRSGGKGSGLYKSLNGGDSWSKIENGLPKDSVGRIALAVSPATPNLIYALVEANQHGLYRSNNGGESWEKSYSGSLSNERPFYFALIVADPVEKGRLYKPGFSLNVSNDSGKSFRSAFVSGGNVHSDHHAIWIDPTDNKNIYLGTDGGVYISHDKGNSWRFAADIPVSQYYHVAFDRATPYNVYGGLQDNGAWRGPSSSPGGITNSDWENLTYGDGFNLIPDPYNPEIVYSQYQGGNLMRFHNNSGEVKDIMPYSPDVNVKYRFNWNTPIYLSPSQKDVLYAGSQFLLKSTDHGDSWVKISPDLTTNDPQKQRQEESGGITIDNSTAENHCTIFTISESPKNKNIIWAGTDDGNLQVTSNGGKEWLNTVTNIQGLPKNTWCYHAEASRYDEKTAYAVFDGHWNGDLNPYIFKTTDLGKSWTKISSGTIESFCFVLREDILNKNLLFVGTDRGLYLSLDGGINWVKPSDIPEVSIRDMAIQPDESDLILATHGRGVVIIDDISTLRSLTPGVLQNEVTFLPAKPAFIKASGYRVKETGDQAFYAPNESESAVIAYYLKSKHIFGDMFIEVFNNRNEKIADLNAGKSKGLNKVLWPVRRKVPNVPANPGLIGKVAAGPFYPPGTYTVKLTKKDTVFTTQIVIKDDPKSLHSPAERKLQIETVETAYSLLEEIASFNTKLSDLIARLDSLKESGVSPKLAGSINMLVTTFKEYQNLIAADSKSRLSGESKLREKAADVYSGIIGYLGAPTTSQIEALKAIKKEVTRIKDDFTNFSQTSEELLNKRLKDEGRPGVKF
ncbi:MAG: glycosyl hydrolase [Ignavibacteriales bacterium]|nr:glycosyl hydrolase [Ignavibacteriales bacterium]